MAIAEDAASIASLGLFEAIVQAGEVDSRDELDAIAAAWLARGVEEPAEIEIETDDEGYEPGQLVTVNVSSPAINDSFIISSVNMQELSVA